MFSDKSILTVVSFMTALCVCLVVYLFVPKDISVSEAKERCHNRVCKCCFDSIYITFGQEEFNRFVEAFDKNGAEQTRYFVELTGKATFAQMNILNAQLNECAQY